MILLCTATVTYIFATITSNSQHFGLHVLHSELRLDRSQTLKLSRKFSVTIHRSWLHWDRAKTNAKTSRTLVN